MFKIKYLTVLPLVLFSGLVQASETSSPDIFRYPYYLGLRGGYGSTTWEGLVPSENNQNAAMVISTPTYVNEGGAVWGAFAGYEFLPFFALEASYLHYPDATITFSPLSLFSFQNNGQTEMTTHTDLVALMAKIMFVIPHTAARVYSSFGAGGVHRYDQLSNIWRVSPNFGAGINYNFTEHIMAELGGSYTGGYGESELNPSENYLPFLYSAFLGLAYRF